MAQLRHRNVVSFMGFVRSPPAIVTEFCAGGSLSDVLKAALSDPGGRKAKELTWGRRLNMVSGAAAVGDQWRPCAHL